MSEFQAPDDLRYTSEHEWILRTGPDTARVGITDYAQSQLGDVVFVQLPEVGTEYSMGDAFGEVESTKSVSDVYVPLAGTISAVNSTLEANPETVNSDPYGDGWLIEVQAESEDDLTSALGATLDAAGYKALTEG